MPPVNYFTWSFQSICQQLSMVEAALDDKVLTYLDNMVNKLNVFLAASHLFTDKVFKYATLKK